jgi:hypothetical protein
MFEKITEVDEAFDERNVDPNKNYGIHGVQLRFVLKGTHGASQFLLFTNRHLPHVHQEFLGKIFQENPHLTQNDREKIANFCGPFTKNKEIEEVIEWQQFLNKLELKMGTSVLISPMAADIGFHSPVPIYEGQEPVREILKKLKMTDEGFIPPVYGDPVICPYLDNDMPCYYEGSSLKAESVWREIVRYGKNRLWEKLESWYNSTVDGGLV